MGTVHRLIEEHGKTGAIVRTELERQIVEAAAAFMGDEDNALGFVYSGWAQTALPHRRLLPGEPWQVISDRTTLIIQPGLRPAEKGEADGKPVPVGVPFGAHARLILLFLQTQALRTGSREIELGASLRGWMSRVGIQHGGSAFRSVRDQGERISRCRLTFEITGPGRQRGLVSQSVVDRALFLDDERDARQGRLSFEKARLSEGYFEQLQKHSVPLQEAAIRAISNNSAALDAYVWLAYRLHSLNGPTKITWSALKAQFGANYGKLFHFKARWPTALQLAMAVYPEAIVEIEDAGLILRPSPPPVAPRVRGIRQG